MHVISDCNLLYETSGRKWLFNFHINRLTNFESILYISLQNFKLKNTNQILTDDF